jgi:predicted nuclease of restriction endonuclease-like (RecB) superfamily
MSSRKQNDLDNKKSPVITNKSVIANNLDAIGEAALFERVSEIIDGRKSRAGAYANREITLMYWEIGQCINSVVLNNKRAEYGKRIVSELATQLVRKYGSNFEIRNLRRIMQFSEVFMDFEIVSELATQLSWSHFVELLPIQSDEARMYYARDAVARNLGTKQLRIQISRKAYERGKIANTRVSNVSQIPFNVFKDPYLLDVLDLKENFMEADLEKAILTELEKFILEFGHGFTFIARQKRMTIESDDSWLDLLFYHRDLKRLVAVELKIGKFIPQYEGQMRFYLKWLNRYERRESENEPIGLILCTKANRSQIELMELDKSGIAVAEYWTILPPKALLEEKIQSILQEAQERLERRKLLPNSNIQKQVDYFYEAKDDDRD